MAVALVAFVTQAATAELMLVVVMLVSKRRRFVLCAEANLGANVRMRQLPPKLELCQQVDTN